MVGMWGGDNYEEGKKDGQIDRWREGETERVQDNLKLGGGRDEEKRGQCKQGRKEVKAGKEVFTETGRNRTRLQVYSYAKNQHANILVLSRCKCLP